MSTSPVFYIASLIILYLSLTSRAGSSISEQNVGYEPFPICLSKCSKNITDTPTGKFCTEVAGKLHGRCCENSTETNVIIGIDLQQCGINEKTFSVGIENMTDLLYISLQDNDIKQITSEDFHGNTKIQYLSLPEGLKCPGGPDFWNSTSISSDNVTICIEELDACQVPNVTCPKNSHCIHTGVGLIECLCDEGYYGYKCMNQGTFPALEFGLGIALPTVVLSALLWVTQRRYVKTSIKKK